MEESKVPSYIAIEGPIGVGKTSLARLISKDLGHQLCLEEPDENPFLKDFYENKQKFAFATQIHFVMQRSQQINKFFSDSLIKQKIISDFIFEKEDLFAKLNLTDEELKIFNEVKSKFYSNSPKPDLVIYLQASPKQLIERVKTRGKNYEEQMSLDYLQRICEMYADFFFNYYESPILVINVDNIDFVSNQDDYKKLLSHINREIVGKEYISLSPSIF
tara:strand:+ start:10404 stop:11057 length:654 start_codon:yes stop_codon:yes gene_type:complete